MKSKGFFSVMVFIFIAVSVSMKPVTVNNDVLSLASTPEASTPEHSTVCFINNYSSVAMQTDCEVPTIHVSNRTFKVSSYEDSTSFNKSIKCRVFSVDNIGMDLFAGGLLPNKNLIPHYQSLSQLQRFNI